MPIVQIDNSEIATLVAYVQAKGTPGAVITALLQRLAAARQTAIRQALRDLFAAGADGTIYQADYDAAIAAGVTNAQADKVVTATTGAITPNPPPASP